MELGDHIGKPCARSRRGEDLKIRLLSLGISLQVSKTLVAQNQNDVDRIHALRVLAHAEVQDYLEGIARTILDTSRSFAATRQELTHAGHHLLVYYSTMPLSQPQNARTGRYPDFQSANARSRMIASNWSELNSFIAAHEKRIRKNNGLKESNTRMLLTPLGFRENMFRPGLLDLLDSFGEARGHVAHGSGIIGAGASNWPSGSSEWGRLTQILPGLFELDRFVPRLLMPVG